MDPTYVTAGAFVFGVVFGVVGLWILLKASNKLKGALIDFDKIRSALDRELEKVDLDEIDFDKLEKKVKDEL